MVFSHRIAALAAVVVIPLGIAATSYALTDSPETPKVPPQVELGSGSPSVTPSTVEPSRTWSPTPAPTSASTPTSTSTSTSTPSDQVVSRPPVSDDDDDGPGDDGPDDDGPGDDG